MVALSVQMGMGGYDYREDGGSNCYGIKTWLKGPCWWFNEKQQPGSGNHSSESDEAIILMIEKWRRWTQQRLRQHNNGTAGSGSLVATVFVISEMTAMAVVVIRQFGVTNLRDKQ